MVCFFDNTSLEDWSSRFAILTPIVLFLWFLYSRWAKNKTEYFKEIAGLYGGFISNTINIPTTEKDYMGGITMEIFDIDNNGYFRGQFNYTEQENLCGIVGGRPAKTRTVSASINFFSGKLSFRWNFSLRKRNPLLWMTNRIYKGEMYTVGRLDQQAHDEKQILERVYKITHHRESRIIEFTQIRANKETHKLPKSFILLKSFNHLLDPYKGVKTILEKPDTD